MLGVIRALAISRRGLSGIKPELPGGIELESQQQLAIRAKAHRAPAGGALRAFKKQYGPRRTATAKYIHDILISPSSSPISTYKNYSRVFNKMNCAERECVVAGAGHGCTSLRVRESAPATKPAHLLNIHFVSESKE
jgi:hypothetical protein